MLIIILVISFYLAGICIYIYNKTIVHTESHEGKFFVLLHIPSLLKM